MSVLILKNISTEGPGTIEEFLRGRGVKYHIAELKTGIPVVSPDTDTLVIMGGPMSVNEENIYPYISWETELVKEFIEKGKKVLGICLGAQIIAKALGSKVYAGPQKEIGWYDIELREGALTDPLMGGLITNPDNGEKDNKIRVFHWHGETFDLPSGSMWLAKSGLYPHQAFSYGKGVYAFQFHIEVTKEMICDWLRKEPIDFDAVKRDTEDSYDVYLRRAMNFYKAFFEV